MKKRKNAGILGKLAFKLSFFCAVFLLFTFCILIMGIVSSVTGDNSQNGAYNYAAGGGFPDSVEAYRPLITNLCEEYNSKPEELNLSDYVNAMLALIQVESGGTGTDPMQASECGYNKKYAHSPNAIKDAEYSCRCGVQYARDAFIKFGVEGPVDFERLAVAVQGYNFGIDGWYAWISSRGGKYSVALAQEYSDTKMPAGAKGTPTHGQKFLTAYQNGIAGSSGDEEVKVNENIADPGGTGEKMAKWGMQYVGCHYSMDYRWSNCYINKSISKNNSYWDCSSFAWCAMDYVGISISRDTSTAAAEAKWCADKDVIVCNGYDTSKMQVGDLIFYKRVAAAGQYKSIGHVSIYIGNGRCVHAKGTDYGVVAGDVTGIDTIVFVARPAVLVKED